MKRRRHDGSMRIGGARGRSAGFTLIEVMIVLAIVLALGGLVAVNVFQRRDDAKRDTAKIEMNTIQQALKQFRFDFDRYPTDEEGLQVLWERQALVVDNPSEEAKWHKYLDKPMPADRWGTPWGYRQVSERGDETEYDLWSAGPDRVEDTEDDLTSWTEVEGEFGEELPPPRAR